MRPHFMFGSNLVGSLYYPVLTSLPLTVRGEPFRTISTFYGYRIRIVTSAPSLVREWSVTMMPYVCVYDGGWLVSRQPMRPTSRSVSQVIGVDLTKGLLM